jgi:hypothetical protein
VASLKVRGVPGVLKALETFDKELAKATAKEISRAGREIVKDAKDEVPDRPGRLRNWRNIPARIPRGRRNRDGTYARGLTRGGEGWPAWKPTDIRSSIKSRRRDVTLTIMMTEASGSIYAVAGTQTGGRSPQGEAFIRNLDPLSKSQGRGGRAGRIMVPAVRKNYRDIIETIDKEIFQVVREVNRKV